MILWILAGVFGVWQAWLFVAGLAMMVNPAYRNVRVGIAPGLGAVVLATVAYYVGG